MPRDDRGRFIAAERTTTTTTVTERLTIHEGHGELAGRWAKLTAPLTHYQVPVIITDAERAANDAYRDQVHAGRAADQAALDEWHAAAGQATFGPLLDWLRQLPMAKPELAGEASRGEATLTMERDDDPPTVRFALPLAPLPDVAP